MVDSRVHIAVAAVPITGALVQEPGQVRFLLLQAMAQRACQQPMITIPVASVVQRNGEDVGLLQRLEHGLPVVPAGQGIAQVAVQPFEQRRLQQKRLAGRGQPGQDLANQVFRYVLVVSGEGADESVYKAPDKT